MEDLIKKLSAEVKGQPEILEKFGRQGLPNARPGSIFVGAGDSYAAAQLGFFASGHRCMALDPYVLASNPEIAEGNEVYFISISGRTRSNLLAARRARRHARRTTALTAVPDSPLARLTDRVVALPMAYLPRAPGMLSFSLTSLAVMKISGVQGRCEYEAALRKAEGGKMEFAEGDGTTYFLGNSLAYPPSLYAAAKVYEVLGSKAHAELLEEFSHLELFSLDEADAVNSFSCFDPAGKAAGLNEALAGRGSVVVEDWGRTSIEKVFHAIFQVQLSVLREAGRRGITAPMFLSRKSSLAASDRMIY